MFYGIPYPIVAVIVSLILCITVILGLLIRGRRLREKYTVLWVVVGAATVVMLFPPVFVNLSRVLQVSVPSNLLFFCACVLLLFVSLHLSVECSALEEENRSMCEELAMLSDRVRVLEDKADASPGDNPGARS